jgi:SAM-dependent methyltransferase
MKAATAEAVALLADLGATPAPGGPLAEQPGIAWIALPREAVAAASERLPRLGYTAAVAEVLPAEEATAGDSPVRWGRRPHALRVLYEADPEFFRSRAPDRRAFLLEGPSGAPRRVTGYRGGAAQLSHRALPVHDARLLVNLAFRPQLGVLLDPFAGAGGIVLEARDAGWTVLSTDLDPALRFGLSELATVHLVADARALPLGHQSVDAIATEPPYHPSATGMLLEGLGELARVLRRGGRLTMLVGAGQRPHLLTRAEQLGFCNELDTPVDRKGTAVAALVWTRQRGPVRPVPRR